MQSRNVQSPESAAADSGLACGHPLPDLWGDLTYIAMPAAPAARLTLSPEAYLEWEEGQDEKHEYYRGEVFPVNRGEISAMAGGTETRARIITNLVIVLGNALRGSDCTVYTEALRVHVEAHDLYTYPDLSVVCGEAAFADERRTSLLNPSRGLTTAGSSAARTTTGGSPCPRWTSRSR